MVSHRCARPFEEVRCLNARVADESNCPLGAVTLTAIPSLMTYRSIGWLQQSLGRHGTPVLTQAVLGYQVSRNGRFFWVRGGGAGTESSMPTMHFRESAGSMTSSKAKATPAFSARPLL